MTVISDDREVRNHALRNGARVEGTGWLAERVAALGRRGTGIGHSRAPAQPPRDAARRSSAPPPDRPVD